MDVICGAAHPNYKKVFCCFGPNHATPHGAALRRGQWVHWLKAGPAVARKFHRIDGPPDQERIPRVMYLVDDDHSRIGVKSRGMCWYCGAIFMSLRRTLDHVVPRSKGGSNAPSNLVLACQPCNTEKGNKSLETYRSLVIKRNGSALFYGETIETRGELYVKPKQPLRVIQTLEEAVAFTRE